jgi:hypothetical protein
MSLTDGSLDPGLSRARILRQFLSNCCLGKVAQKIAGY